MGAGSYLASEAEERLYAAEIRDEGQEVVDHLEREVAELALVLVLGALKGRVTRQRLGRAGTQVLLIGSLSAAVGYGVGRLVSGIAG